MTDLEALSSDPLVPALSDGLPKLGLELPANARHRLIRYLRLIERWNKVYNLTAVREPAAMLTQHLFDCLAIVPPLRRGLVACGLAGRPIRVLDVGSGAGLPGVVLAICQPEWTVTCVDAVAKKASFIRQVAAELGLSNLRATHQRVEAMGADDRFELITSRAFASLADFVNLSGRRLEDRGCWVAMKAHLTDDERTALPQGVELFHVEPLQVPGLNAARCLVWLRRTPAASGAEA